TCAPPVQGGRAPVPLPPDLGGSRPTPITSGPTCKEARCMFGSDLTATSRARAAQTGTPGLANFYLHPVLLEEARDNLDLSSRARPTQAAPRSIPRYAGRRGRLDEPARRRESRIARRRAGAQRR